MDDDQLLHLSISVTRNPGVYALLIGSGVSRPAGISTGWEIMENLIRQLAGQTKLDDPFQWYLDKYETEPTYDSLVGKFGRKSFERNALLRPYFEPTDEERESNLKIPAPAHKAIAKMVKSGFIRVILTTNFDRLLEKALEAEGIQPDVISTVDGINGARPLQHSSITIIKLHGDYLDGRIKNTADELRQYEVEMDKLLDRVLDEYGLIVCGWSAEWDEALRNAFYRAPNRRYSTYWAQFGGLKEDAKRLTEHRDAEVIEITGADEFFTTLEANVTAVQATKRQHPLSIPVAVERVKRMLANPQAEIELDQFIHDTLENAYQQTTSEAFYQYSAVKIPHGLKSFDDLSLYLDLYYHEIALALSVVATVCWYGTGQHASQIAQALSRWLEIPQPHDRSEIAYSPVVLLIYTAGIAAIARKRWIYLQAVLADPFVSTPFSSGTLHPTFLDYVAEKMLKALAGNNSLTMNTAQLNVRLGSRLRPVFQQLLPSEKQYNNAFDLFEVLLSLCYRANSLEKKRSTWMPPHIACYSNRSWEYIKLFWQQGGRLRKDWELLQIEPFRNDINKLEEALTEYVVKARQYQESKLHGADDGAVPDYAEIYGNARSALG